MKVCLSHIVVERLQLNEHHEAGVPHVLDLLVDEEHGPAQTRSVLGGPGVVGALSSRRSDNNLFEYLIEFVLSKEKLNFMKINKPFAVCACFWILYTGYWG